MLGAENEEFILRQSGVPMVGVGIIPQPGSNYLDIAKEFYKRFEQIKKVFHRITGWTLPLTTRASSNNP